MTKKLKISETGQVTTKAGRVISTDELQEMFQEHAGVNIKEILLTLARLNVAKFGRDLIEGYDSNPICSFILNQELDKLPYNDIIEAIGFIYRSEGITPMTHTEVKEGLLMDAKDRSLS